MDTGQFSLMTPFTSSWRQRTSPLWARAVHPQLPWTTKALQRVMTQLLNPLQTASCRVKSISRGLPENIQRKNGPGRFHQ
jgi:hypothetical protein